MVQSRSPSLKTVHPTRCTIPALNPIYPDLNLLFGAISPYNHIGGRGSSLDLALSSHSDLDTKPFFILFNYRKHPRSSYVPVATCAGILSARRELINGPCCGSLQLDRSRLPLFPKGGEVLHCKLHTPCSRFGLALRNQVTPDPEVHIKFVGSDPTYLMTYFFQIVQLARPIISANLSSDHTRFAALARERRDFQSLKLRATYCLGGLWSSISEVRGLFLGDHGVNTPSLFI